MALEGVYPIIIDGELMGKLTVTVQGGYTVFDAVCRPLAGIVRVSAYGGGREGCLGILAPDGEQLSLHKKLSRADLRDFPQEIESVERSGARREKTEALQSEADRETEAPPEENDELFWYSSPDGALVCFDGQRSLIALPLGDERIPEGYGGYRRRVGGKEYLVYITKNGRIVHEKGRPADAER